MVPKTKLLLCIFNFVTFFYENVDQSNGKMLFHILGYSPRFGVDVDDVKLKVRCDKSNN